MVVDPVYDIAAGFNAHSPLIVRESLGIFYLLHSEVGKI